MIGGEGVSGDRRDQEDPRLVEPSRRIVERAREPPHSHLGQCDSHVVVDGERHVAADARDEEARAQGESATPASPAGEHPRGGHHHREGVGHLLLRRHAAPLHKVVHLGRWQALIGRGATGTVRSLRGDRLLQLTPARTPRTRAEPSAFHRPSVFASACADSGPRRSAGAPSSQPTQDLDLGVRQRGRSFHGSDRMEVAWESWCWLYAQPPHEFERRSERENHAFQMNTRLHSCTLARHDPRPRTHLTAGLTDAHPPHTT